MIVTMPWLRRLSAAAFAVLMTAAYSPSLRAATFVVNSTVDALDANPGDGVCETAVDNGVCTLRAATQEARQNTGQHTIVLPAGTYQLSIPRNFTQGQPVSGTGGALLMIGAITLVGAGEDLTIIDGGALDSVIISQPTEGQLVGVTIRNGKAHSDSPSGGGILNQGVLTLQNVTVKDSVGITGGGIANFGTMVIDECTISGNMPDDSGGNGPRGGRGIWNSGSLKMQNSTISGNTAADLTDLGPPFGVHDLAGGAGIQNEGTIDLTNVTISDNVGGAISSASLGANYFANVTITANAAADAVFGSAAVGIGTVVNSAGDVTGTHRFRNSIISGNARGNCSANVASTLVSEGYNLDSDNSCGFGGDGTSIVGQSATLETLAFWGGPTKTRLLSTGPGTDAGDPAGCSNHEGPILRDQRGGPRSFGGLAGHRCDIGATESGDFVATAGRNRRVNPGQPVTLDGNNSFADPTVSVFSWTQTAGATVALSGAQTAFATFTAPQNPGPLDFQLSLRFGLNPATSTDSVTVTVNAPPVANAGPDMVASPSLPATPRTVTLNGQGSSDPDGVIVGYAWVQTGGPSVALTGANKRRASFQAPEVPNPPGTELTFQLTVTDNEGLSNTDSVVVTVPTSFIPPAPAGGGGGGCTLGGDSPFDPSLPSLVVLATLVLWRRRERV